VSDQPVPSTYIKTTMVIALVLIVAMVLFLKKQWFGH
jgi:hypothetical protein